ncbi:hypothetical protein [Paraglaciecola psychrophila]|uniref:hypothetical protein n=1 Tax=Paraglaciecola psychrophila TaxID=326544 RepID=UPI000291B790|nr:hypothetical protein [Paraglaciecola psychrophila]GAC37853.1 hypothetical protein GPSY_2232 [Paraglaciecola psychrophila 170]
MNNLKLFGLFLVDIFSAMGCGESSNSISNASVSAPFVSAGTFMVVFFKYSKNS